MQQKRFRIVLSQIELMLEWAEYVPNQKRNDDKLIKKLHKIKKDMVDAKKDYFTIVIKNGIKYQSKRNQKYG